ncbi:MAG: LacI family DNA-binding transcriptional regulator [Lachnospiraceae bacterium]|nr:LacI family DNA-binding transcriptional regulator [Lachnospiraceae bacterium]
MATLKEIAAACGVSPTTVSNILNGKSKASEETARRVREMVRQMDYQPNYMAKGLRTQRTKTVAIIAEDINQFTTPFIIGAAMSGLEENGYRTILENLRMYERWRDTWYDSDSALQSMVNPALRECRAFNVDGIIYIAGHARKIRCFPDDFDIPVVMTYAYAVSDTIPSVVIDDEEGAYEVMKYLLEKGHRRVAFVTGRSDNIHTQLRMRGAARALYEYNCPYNPYLVVEGNWNRVDGRSALEKLNIAEQGVTAVFAMNDEMAAGAYDVVESYGLKVGEDISVIGFDNAEIAQYYRPGLTTTELPLHQIGRKAAELLVDILDNEESTAADGQVYRFPCSFVERQSVKEI